MCLMYKCVFISIYVSLLLCVCLICVCVNITGPINDPTVWNHITTFEDSKPDRPFGDMKPETRQILQDFYKSHNTKLGAMLGPEFDYNTNS